MESMSSAANRDELIQRFTRERYVLEGYIASIVRDRHLAEDVYQDVALEAMRCLDRYNPERDWRAWIYGIARNKAKQALSRTSRLQPLPEEPLQELIDLAYAEQSDERMDALTRTHAWLHDCLRAVPESLVPLIRMRYWDNLAFKTIGAKVGKSAGSIQVALSRVRLALMECIQKKRVAELEVSA